MKKLTTSICASAVALALAGSIVTISGPAATAVSSTSGSYVAPAGVISRNYGILENLAWDMVGEAQRLRLAKTSDARRESVRKLNSYYDTIAGYYGGTSASQWLVAKSRFQSAIGNGAYANAANLAEKHGRSTATVARAYITNDTRNREFWA